MLEKKYLLLLSVLTINLVLVLTPAFVFDLPITQTDGATHYIYAKVFSESLDIDSPNPEYNKIGSGETKISDYPPFTTIVFGLLLKSGNDIFLINGGLGAIFFLIASISLFLFVRDLTKNSKIALIALMFFVLNIRAYYTLFTGIYPAFISFCLAIPALYFSFRFFSGLKTRDLIFAFSLTSLVALTYTVYAFYLIFLEFMLWVGIRLEEKISINFPKFNLKIKKIGFRDFKNLIYFMIPSIAFLFLVISRFALQESALGRKVWLSEWASGLLKSCPGYPCVWKYFFIVDGPLLLLFAIFGLVYLVYRKNWKIVSLFLGGLFIVLSGFLIEGGIVYFIYRFYTLFFVLLAIPASIFIYKIISMKDIRVIGIILLVISLSLHAGMLGYFYTQFHLAISEDEYTATKELLKYNSSPILYVNNDIEEGTFKAFKWIVVFSKSNDYVVANEVPNKIGADYVFIKNTDNLNKSENDALSKFDVVFESGKTRIYKTS